MIAVESQNFAYRWDVAGVHRIDEIVEVVLMVAFVAIPCR